MPGLRTGVHGRLPSSLTYSRLEQQSRWASEKQTAETTDFALRHEADAMGIAPMDPLYVFEGYDINEPWVIILAWAHDYKCLKQVPYDETNGAGVSDVGEQYARGTRASFALANWIRSRGYNASARPGPSASALLLIPPAIAAGLGELGKHGSMISRKFGADEFCSTCQVCTNACPPGAILEQKQIVRGVERWFVDFNKCIPFFAENSPCGICVATCPWKRQDVRPKLLATMANRMGQGVSS